MAKISDEIIGEIERILEERLSAAGWEIKRYGCIEDFHSLWEIGGNEIRNNNILVIWDGFPPNAAQRASLKEFITPIDWAFAYSKRHVEKEGLNIVIFDECSNITEKFPHSNEKIKAFCQSALEKMQNWVRFYSFNDKFQNRSNPFKILAELKPAQPLNDNQQEANLEPLLEEWGRMIGEVVKNEENYQSRHSMNNSLGPIQLAEATIQGEYLEKMCGKYPHNAAFYNIFKWCYPDDNPTPNNLQELTELKVADDENTTIILMDDQASDGWADLLTGWTGHNIKSYENVDFIIDKLGNINDDDNPPQELNFSELNDKEIAEILLLDLHLFAPNDRDNQIKYFQRVLKLSAALKPPDSKLTDDNIRRLKEDLNAGRHDNGLIDYLTLLPRLMAEIKPNIPIIIFSASEQPIDNWGYENIKIYRKPLHKNLSVFKKLDNPIEKRNEFIKSINWAIDFNNRHGRRRTFLRRFSPHKDTAILPKSRFSPYNPNVKGDLRVDLYLDEQGNAGIDEDFTIGGIYVVGLVGHSIWDALNNAPSNYHIRWGWDKLNQYKQGIFAQGAEIGEQEKRGVRTFSFSCLGQIVNDVMKPISIHAVKLTSTKNHVGGVDTLDLSDAIRKTIRRVNGVIDNGIDDIINDHINRKLFASEIINLIFHKYDRDRIDHFNREFNRLYCNTQLARNIAQQYMQSLDCHLKVLENLIKLFLKILIPTLEDKSGKSVVLKNIYYATLTRQIHLAIAKVIRKERSLGYKHRFPNNQPRPPIRTTYFISEDSLQPSHYDLNIRRGDRLLGVTLSREEATNLHHIADAVLFCNGNQIVQNLYGYPGINANKEDLDKLLGSRRYLYSGYYEDAFQIIENNDDVWNTINGINEDENNTVRSYVGKFLARKLLGNN